MVQNKHNEVISDLTDLKESVISDWYVRNTCRNIALVSRHLSDICIAHNFSKRSTFLKRTLLKSASEVLILGLLFIGESIFYIYDVDTGKTTAYKSVSRELRCLNWHALIVQFNCNKIFCGYCLMHGKVEDPFHVKPVVAYIITQRERSRVW